MESSNNLIHEANRRRWNVGAKRWAERADSRSIWKDCVHDPSLALSSEALKALDQVAAKQICVLGSGDNEVVFALASMGAKLTSVDISEAQLDIAAQRAEQLGLSIAFLRSDVTNLSALEADQFDLVYTGGHVAVWVSDLKRYYAEAIRILRPNGRFIVDEYHPFRRIWMPQPDQLRVEMSYFERGPFKYSYNEDVLTPTEGKYDQFEFHWTISDYVAAILEGGCRLQQLVEYGTRCEDWEGAPMEGLPNCLLIVGQKETLS